MLTHTVSHTERDIEREEERTGEYNANEEMLNINNKKNLKWKN